MFEDWSVEERTCVGEEFVVEILFSPELHDCSVEIDEDELLLLLVIVFLEKFLDVIAKTVG